MKTVGIIGGIGPEATISYYRLIITSYLKLKQDGSYPLMIINSIDLSKLVDLLEANALTRLADYMVDELEKLSLAGVDFAVLSSNTPHIVFDEINRRSPVPLISILETTCEAARSLGLKRLGLLGTRFTMQGQFYTDVFSKAGMSIVSPDKDEQTYIHEKYMNEFLLGSFLPETRERLLELISGMKEKEGIDGLILGGTELPLILRSEDVKDMGLTFLDTTQIHVNAIVKRLLS